MQCIHCKYMLYTVSIKSAHIKGENIKLYRWENYLKIKKKIDIFLKNDRKIIIFY